MIDNGYVFAKDNKRIFINTSLGCSGKCSYCYLPQLGYSNNSINFNTTTAEWIIDCLEKSDLKINENTLITIGCYSECWDSHNVNETIKLIKHFLKKGNQIQLSTKKQIKESELSDILPLIQYYGQLIVFVSATTISKHHILEKNTTPIEQRFENFILLNKLNIPSVLYIKPVLKGITVKDVDLFKEYIVKHHIANVVVGSIFTNEQSNETVHFSNKNELFYNKIDDEDILIRELSKNANVYRRSTEAVNSFKVYKYIKNLKVVINEMFKGDKSGHDISHLERTTNLALYLQQKEGGDKIVIGISAFLHDVHRIMQNQLGRFVAPKDSLTKIKEILSTTDLTKTQIDKICYCIEYHEEYNWNGNNVDDLNTLILQDADNLDAIGAIGIIRNFKYSIAHNIIDFDPNVPLYQNEYNENKEDASTIHHMNNKLLRLGEYMNTKTAKRLAKSKTKLIRDFMNMFIQEFTGKYD